MLRPSRWSTLLVAVTAGCAHSTTPRPPAVSETAVGAYLRNPVPHRVASLASCTFRGAVSRDLRPTAPGPITAHCPGKIVLHWNAMIANGLVIEGPLAIEIRNSTPTSYAYSALYTAGTTRLAGDARFSWSLGPGCDGSAELNDVGDGTFVLPKMPGRCLLLARDPEGHTAQLALTIKQP